MILLFLAYDLFWVDFCEEYKVCIKTDCFVMNAQLFQHHLLKRLSLLNSIDFTPLPNISWLIICGSIYELSVPLICLVLHQYYTAYFYSVIVSLVLESFSPPTLFLSFSIVLTISCLLSLHINFRVSLSIATKEVARIFLLGLVRSSWEEETSWYYQVFQPMNV